MNDKTWLARLHTSGVQAAAIQSLASGTHKAPAIAFPKKDRMTAQVQQQQAMHQGVYPMHATAREWGSFSSNMSVCEVPFGLQLSAY